jgi:hypothetical protein
MEGLPIEHCSSGLSSPESPLQQWNFPYSCPSPFVTFVSMSRHAGPTNEQVQYEKNTVPIDDRRDSRIRGNIGATLEIFSKEEIHFP